METTSDLEQKLDLVLIQQNVSVENQRSIKFFLGLVKSIDIPTYEHLIKVGFYSLRFSKYFDVDPNPMLYSGLLHDIGKVLIPVELLKKTQKFDENDMKIMRRHPEFTYQLLKDVHPFSAEMGLRHHTHQPDPYPILPPNKRYDHYSRILAFADYYDSITTRNDDHFGLHRKMDAREIQSRMIEQNPDLEYAIVQMNHDDVI